MKEFDYIILGGGLSGLTLAYELNKQGCKKGKNTQETKAGLTGTLKTISFQIA